MTRRLVLTLLLCHCAEPELEVALRQPTCGNGRIDAGEVCDDGNTTAGDYCSPACNRVTGSCGDRLVQSGESCDDGDTSDDGNGCSAACVLTAECGNGVVEAYLEDCDDGNTSSGDLCAGDCSSVTPGCGDAYLDPGETCDDGNRLWGDYCGDDCASRFVQCHELELVRRNEDAFRTIDDIAGGPGGSMHVVGAFGSGAGFGVPGATFGPITLSSTHPEDGYAAKHAANGTPAWAKSWGGTWDDNASAVLVDEGGNVYIAGRFDEYAQFGGTTIFVEDNGLYVVSLTPSGVQRWVTIAESEGLWPDLHLAFAPDGALVLAGTCGGSLDFPSTSIWCFANREPGGFMAKLSRQGEVLWAKTRYGQQQLFVSDVDVASDGSIFLAGLGLGSSSYVVWSDDVPRTGLYPEGYDYHQLIKTDSSGEVLWGRTFGGRADMITGDVVAGNDGGVAVTAMTFASGVEGDVNLTLSPSVLLVRYDGEGVLQWSRAWASAHELYRPALAADRFGQLYASGRMPGSMTLDLGNGVALHNPGAASSSYLAKLNRFGMVQWVTTPGDGGAALAPASALASLADGGLLIAGAGYLGRLAAQWQPRAPGAGPNCDTGMW
jgi:cysteine-rich repeat protein